MNETKLNTEIDKDKPYWPYWFIDDKLYDLEPWLEKHPGGADFLHRCRGTDCTAAFEVHHMRMPKAKAMLKRFEVQASGPVPQSPWPQFDWAQYAVLRKRIADRLAKQGWRCGPSARGKILALTALLINLVIPFIWGVAGSWAILLAFVYCDEHDHHDRIWSCLSPSQHSLAVFG